MSERESAEFPGKDGAHLPFDAVSIEAAQTGTSGRTEDVEDSMLFD